MSEKYKPSEEEINKEKKIMTAKEKEISDHKAYLYKNAIKSMGAFKEYEENLREKQTKHEEDKEKEGRRFDFEFQKDHDKWERKYDRERGYDFIDINEINIDKIEDDISAAEAKEAEGRGFRATDSYESYLSYLNGFNKKSLSMFQKSLSKAKKQLDELLKNTKLNYNKHDAAPTRDSWLDQETVHEYEVMEGTIKNKMIIIEKDTLIKPSYLSHEPKYKGKVNTEPITDVVAEELLSKYRDVARLQSYDPNSKKLEEHEAYQEVKKKEENEFWERHRQEEGKKQKKEEEKKLKEAEENKKLIEQQRKKLKDIL